jgi:maltose alpha-D-glucosyltransferase / alpha-amylase
MFLRNHDELDLGRLTERQRQKVFAAFGPKSEMQLYDRGIRRRLAPMFDGDRRRLELAYSLMFTLPGTPVLRYGDELGMGDDLSLPERNCARTPMQWSNERHGGFTKSEKPHIPVISGGPYGFEHINAAIQRRHPDSLLNWTERIPHAQGSPRGRLGRFHGDPDPRPGGARDAVLVNLLGEEHSRAEKNGRHRLVIEAYGYRWFRVGGLDYLLRRSDIDQPTKQSKT